MDRRTFLTSLVGAVASKLVVADIDPNDGVTLSPLPQAVPKTEQPPLVFDFGGLTVLGGDLTTLNIQTPYQKCPVTQQKTVSRHTTVTCTRLVAPKAVWDEVFRRYAEVTKARENAPLKILVGPQCVATIEYALFTSLGTQVTGDNMVVCESVSLIGVWKELREACERYVAAYENETPESRKAFFDAEARLEPARPCTEPH